MPDDAIHLFENDLVTRSETAKTVIVIVTVTLTVPTATPPTPPS